MMNDTIDRFDGTEYEFLSNFYPSEVFYKGMFYPTVEHAFQAAKTLDPREREKIRAASTPGRAKYLGRTTDLRDDWEDIKFEVMEYLVRQKFTPPPRHLWARLLATGDAELIEGNTWGDTIWGVVDGVGENHLGKILMKVRAELQDERDHEPRPDPLPMGVREAERDE